MLDPELSALVRLALAPMRAYVLAVLMCVAPAPFVLGGCGSVYYSVNVSAATSRLEQARQMGAEQSAPYEYYYAREHLRQAQVEAAQASYGDAAAFAETAEMYAQKAIDLIQSSRRGEGK